MHRWLKHLVIATFVVLLAGCGGGGCSSGCAGCGMAPLPNGYPVDQRIDNAAGVRLTDSGLAFLQANIGTLAGQLVGGGANAGVITFDVPKTSGSTTGITYAVCPNGAKPTANPPECVVEADLGKSPLTISSKGPSNLVVGGKINLRLRKLPFTATAIFIPLSSDIAISGNGSCPGDASAAGWAQIPVNIDISIETDTNAAHTSRYGLSHVVVKNVTIDNTALQNSVQFCSGGLSSTLLNLLKGVVFGQVAGSLTGTLTSTISDQLCTKADATATPPCPAGSTDQGGTCKFADGTCVATELGLEGRMDLSGALASVSPGAGGAIDIQLAVGGAGTRADGSGQPWGNLNPINGGATLSMVGGAQADPLSKCVPIANLPLPTGIPVPAELTANTVTDWPAGTPGPHVGIAVAERYLNHALGGMYNAGVLCLGITTDTIPQLSSGIFSLLAPSVKSLTLQRTNAPIAITIRPKKPPVAIVGNGTDIKTDPNLLVSLPNANLDLYIWSSDRFVRAFTLEFDLTIPVNLSMGPAGLEPKLGDIKMANAKASNADLLDPKDVAAVPGAFSSLIGGLTGQLTGSLKPIDLNSSLASFGLSLVIPDSVAGKGSPGIRKLTSGSDNFLGIFAALAPAAAPAPAPSETTALLADKQVDVAGLRLATATEFNRPTIVVRASSPYDDGSHRVEYSYRIDGSAYRPWTTDRVLTVRESVLGLQGKHNIEVTSRLAGEPRSVDTTPARVDFLIDIDPPQVALKRGDDGNVVIDARDIVTRADDLQVRYSVDGAAFGPWTKASEIAALPADLQGTTVTVEARDEEGNVSSAQQSLIRGRPDPAFAGSSSGCGCRVGGDSGPQSGLGFAGALAALVGIVVRRGSRRRFTHAAGALGAIAVAGSYAGCSCGAADDNVDQTVPTDDAGADAKVDADAGHEASCDPATCINLEAGLIGSYTSAAADSSGNVWVAGYAEGDWNNNNSYGDLAVGKWNGTKVDWSLIDGVPTTAVDPNAYNTSGFRGGQTESGDDVGLWTSVALDAGGNPRVAYFDVTHRALKYAAYDGSAWTIQTVDTKANSDIGRYAKLLLVGDKPVIAYLAIVPGTAGAISSKVRLATASKAAPAAAADWTFEDAASNDATPCRPFACATGTKCRLDNGVCGTTATTCTPKCGSGSDCFAGANGAAAACSDLIEASKLDTYPDAAGDYVAAAVTAAGDIGLIYYDRIHGNLMQARKANGKWITAILDGQSAAPAADTGDVGIGASLFIDTKGDWHVSYIDGNQETLRYLLVKGGTAPQAAEVVDTGLGLGTKLFDDGHHIVGDDSNITVTAAGEVHISYQDATSGQLRWAVGATAAAGHTWTVKPIVQDGFAGAFSRQVTASGETKVVNWWRKGAGHPQGDVNLAAP